MKRVSLVALMLLSSIPLSRLGMAEISPPTGDEKCRKAKTLASPDDPTCSVNECGGHCNPLNEQVAVQNGECIEGKTICTMKPHGTELNVTNYRCAVNNAITCPDPLQVQCYWQVVWARPVIVTDCY